MDELAQDQGESFVASEGVAEAQAAPPVDGAVSAGHPAWQEILSTVPEMFHPKIRPTLEKWDKGVQEKLESVRSEWRDWQQFRDAGVDPQTVQYGMQLVNALQSDPRRFYDEIGRHYKFVQEQAPVENIGDESEIDVDDPRIRQLVDEQKRLQQIVYQQQLREQEAAEDAALEKELASLRNKYGEYDERYVLGLMANGQDGESAVRAYKELEARLRGNGQAAGHQAPRVLGSGGGAPTSGAVDPRKLDAAGRKALVAQMLEKAARTGD